MKFAIIDHNIVVNVALADAPLAPNWIASDTAGVGWTYDPVTVVFTAPIPPAPSPAPPPDLRITSVAFKRRMTSAERMAIRALAANNAHVYDYMDLLDSAPVVHLDDADLIGGLQMLESAGTLATGRTAAILAAPIQAGERPT